MKFTLITTLFITSLFLSGCVHNNATPLYYSKESKEVKGFHDICVTHTYIRYNKLADEAVESLFKKMHVPKKLIVTDFVDITSLENQSRLGYVLSNSIKNSLINRYNTDVIEAEVSKYFKISGNGIKILSRDINKLRATNFQIKYAVVGTYTYTESELIVFVKLIDLKTGVIKGSYAKTLPMGDSTRMMLHSK